ncbi:Ig-like domain-containing protein [uncultured Sphaerochaeta sp.]|uniref:Ig-like domain-containing protein n=1 Tax=uncultured Sphaerochaeta sp. TaxID=886478 RepID=UPI002A0A3931|nr:Ig-like domain-containing protein [uncultured Sphaerochaeta sp.]
MKYKMNRLMAFALIVCVLLVTMGCDELLNRPVDVTGVTIAEENQTILVGDTLQLNATVSPNDATNKDVAWTSSDTGVATVSTTGLVTPVAAGSTTITVTTDDGSKTDTISLTVKNEHIIFTLTPTDTTLDTLHFELYSGAHADSVLATYVDLSTNSEVPLVTIMDPSSTTLLGSTKPLDMPSGGQFAVYNEATNGSDIIYAYIELPAHTDESIEIDKSINVNCLSEDDPFWLELIEKDINGDTTMKINAEEYTLTYSVIDTEAGYLEGTISGTVYDVTDLEAEDTIATGTEYTLNLTFKAVIVDVKD